MKDCIVVSPWPRLILRVSEIAEEIVRGVDAVAMRYYEKTAERPVMIRVPWDWGGALYAHVQQRYRDTRGYPVPARLIRVLEGNNMCDIVTFPYDTPIGAVSIEVTPGIAMPQVYGPTR